MIRELKRNIVENAKNIIGWRTKRKIVVFSVDDYGNVRLDSQKARDNMDREGLKIYNRFDQFDTMETRDDLHALYEVLTSFTGKNGNHPVFTTFALPCNINFESMRENDYKEYQYELLPETFEKLSAQQPEAYQGAWQLLNEGIEKGLVVPLFHGREHLNLKLFEEKLAKRDKEVLTALENRSYTSISSSEYDTISAMAAFDFSDVKENERFDGIIRDGIRAFEKVYGYSPDHFNPPGGREHPRIHKPLHELGVKYIDTPLLKNEHQGDGNFKKVFNYTGKKNKLGQVYLVRNVVFEPTEERNINWLDYTMNQVSMAFKWNRPAIISSHRVNFCGHIDEANRKKGLGSLNELLTRITQKWPEVEFLAANELGELINSNN